MKKELSKNELVNVMNNTTATLSKLGTRLKALGILEGSKINIILVSPDSCVHVDLRDAGVNEDVINGIQSLLKHEIGKNVQEYQALVQEVPDQLNHMVQ